jgi:hypothetical protein
MTCVSGSLAVMESRPKGTAMNFPNLVPACLAIVLLPGAAYSQEITEAEACRTTGLIALKERSPSITDVTLDLDSLTIAKADTKIEDIKIKTIVLGEAYLEKGMSDKPHQLICIIGEKGKVLLTFFTER